MGKSGIPICGHRYCDMASSIHSSPDVLGLIGAASASISNSGHRNVWLETMVQDT